jgi:hypothetical protein
MPIIGLVNTDDGSNEDLETTLGLFSVATSASPATFLATVSRGAVAIVPGVLPSDPTVGTLAIDISGSNMLKWWDGVMWRSASTTVEISGGGRSGIGVGQTINLQQGLAANFSIAVSGVLVSITVTSGNLPSGLTLNGATGQITGVPTVFGTYSVDLEATFADSTVGTGTVDLIIAEAFPVTFTFDETPITYIPVGVYVDNFELTYTPFPNALPISWSITGLPPGLAGPYEISPGVQIIYSEPSTAGTYNVTVEATNWAGTTTKNFDIIVYDYNLDVSGPFTFQGTYAPVSNGFYTSSDGGSSIYVENYYNIKIYENTMNNNLKIFYYQPFGCWMMADMSSFTSISSPLFTSPKNTAIPSQSNWYGPEAMSISWVAP